MKQKFIIEGRLESQNTFIFENRCGKFRGNRFKKEQQNIVKEFIQESDLERVLEYPLHVTFFFYEKNRKRDLDNISSWAHKCIMDALKEFGIIENDGWKHVVAYSDYFFVDKENPRIEVYLETVNKAENQNSKQ